jgi:uncharacterized protein (DUF433 family)
MPVSLVFENLEAGMSLDEIAGVFDGIPEENESGSSLRH